MRASDIKKTLFEFIQSLPNVSNEIKEDLIQQVSTFGLRSTSLVFLALKSADRNLDGKYTQLAQPTGWGSLFSREHFERAYNNCLKFFIKSSVTEPLEMFAFETIYRDLRDPDIPEERVLEDYITKHIAKVLNLKTTDYKIRNLDELGLLSTYLKRENINVEQYAMYKKLWTLYGGSRTSKAPTYSLKTLYDGLTTKDKELSRQLVTLINSVIADMDLSVTLLESDVTRYGIYPMDYAGDNPEVLSEVLVKRNQAINSKRAKEIETTQLVSKSLSKLIREFKRDQSKLWEISRVGSLVYNGKVIDGKLEQEIPDRVDGVPVTSIAYTFENMITLKEINHLPKTLVTMENAFSGCIALQKIPAIPDGVENMCLTFNGCLSLNEEPNIPESVTNKNLVFLGCNFDKSSIVRKSTASETLENKGLSVEVADMIPEAIKENYSKDVVQAGAQFAEEMKDIIKR